MQTSFSGHETFPFRYGWLKKGVDAVFDDPRFFSRDRAMIELGVGKNMVQAIKYWCTATGLLHATKAPGSRIEYTPTSMSERVLGDRGYDPFFEDPATLWLMQWNIATNKDLCPTWFYLFNHAHGVEFTKESLFDGLTKWFTKMGAQSYSEKMLRRDIDCCLRTYVRSRMYKTSVSDESFDCPLTELNLISELADGRTYQFRRDEQRSLPDELLLFAVTEFWERSGEKARSLSVERLAFDPGSPGQVFKLDLESLIRRFERIGNSAGEIFSYQESGGIKQIFALKDVPAYHWIDTYYQNN